MENLLKARWMWWKLMNLKLTTRIQWTMMMRMSKRTLLMNLLRSKFMNLWMGLMRFKRLVRIVRGDFVMLVALHVAHVIVLKLSLNSGDPRHTVLGRGNLLKRGLVHVLPHPCHGDSLVVQMVDPHVSVDTAALNPPIFSSDTSMPMLLASRRISEKTLP